MSAWYLATSSAEFGRAVRRRAWDVACEDGFQGSGSAAKIGGLLERGEGERGASETLQNGDSIAVPSVLYTVSHPVVGSS